MDGKGWKTILSSYDTIKYLVKFELIELSKSCISLRNRLKPYLFKDMNFNNFSDKLSDLPLNMIKFDQNIDDFLVSYGQDLNKHVRYVKSLTYENYCNNLLLSYISQIFCNLSRLHLSEASFTLTTFQKLMSNLNQLEHLILNRNLFVVFNTDGNPIILSLPHSLLSFRVSYGELLRVEFDQSLSLSNYLEISDGSNIESIKFEVEYHGLPNLKHLEIDHYFQDFAETGNSLLAASAHLKHLSTRYCIIEGLSSINLQSLTSLTITMINQHYQSNVEAIFPTLGNLKELKIFGGFGINEFERDLIIPRLQRLAIIAKNVKNVTLPYIKSNSFSIKDMLQSFDNLTELSLVPADKLASLNADELPKTIKTLNLYNTSPKYVDIKNLTNCSELRIITIYYNSQTLDNYKFEKSSFYKGIEGWRMFINAGTSIKFYKE